MDFLRMFKAFNTASIKSAVDPIFRLAGLMFCAVLAASPFVPLYMAVSGMAMTGVVLLAGLGVYLYFAWKSPEYLRSEKFHLDMHRLEHYSDSMKTLPAKGQKRVDATSVPPDEEENQENT